MMLLLVLILLLLLPIQCLHDSLYPASYLSNSATVVHP
jgi:hypothetical protein